MAGKDLDALAKELAEERISRGRALKRMGAALLGGLLASVPMTAAFAAPRICLTCACGVGRPCNTKSQVCTEQRGFPSRDAACAAACNRAGFKFCGGVVQTHCPKGCPA
jgi:hypothetical protein